MRFVYIIGFGNPEMVKIGVSNDPFKRIRDVASELEIKEYDIHISRLYKDPFSIERKCHKYLSDFCIGGLGPHKKYKREIFKYEFKKAKELLLKVAGVVKITAEFEI